MTVRSFSFLNITLPHPKKFQFPTRIFGTQKHQFPASWLDRYSGLTYSPTEDGGFCLYCFLFAQCEPSVRDLGVLVDRLLTNFKNAIEKLNEHFVSKSRKSHQAAMEKAMLFIGVKENRIVAVHQQLNSRRDLTIAENHLKLRSIAAATVILCGRQGVAFRVKTGLI